VAQGETLYRIARAHGTSASALAELNGVGLQTPLTVGQVLVVPASAAEPGASRAVSPTLPGRPQDGPSSEPQEADRAGALPPALAAAFEALGPGVAGTSAARETGSPAPPRAGMRQGPGRVESSVLGALPPTAGTTVLGRQAAPAVRASGRAAPLQWPLRGVLYARFGRKGKEPHEGIDLAAPVGTPVRTAGEGTVLFAGPQQGYGLLVIIEHVHGLVTVYAHNRDVRVRTGQTVRDSQVIATVGESGKTSGPHLHFEVRQEGEPVDPLRFLGPPPSS
jgi:lipoprotein NlpD